MSTPNAPHPDPNYPNERGSAADGSGQSVQGQPGCTMDHDGQPTAAQGPRQSPARELATVAPPKAAPAMPAGDPAKKAKKR